ncbi:MAG: hypothetical protein Q8R32_03030 [bacterium]|nr:hypothetical protein [bacterium]
MKLLSGKTFGVIGLILVAAASRLLPHPPNVSPIAAIALLGGASLSLPWSLAIPAAAMLLSDVIIGFDTFPITLSVYGSFLVSVFLGRALRERPSSWRILGTSLASSSVFYLLTNAAVWAFSPLYPQTLDGLILSYLYAIPFFRHTLLGDLAYTVTLFFAYQYAPRLVPIAARRRHAQSQEAYS